MKNFGTAFFETCIGGLYHICHHQANQATDHAMAVKVLQEWAAPIEGLHQGFPEGNSIQRLGSDQAGTQAIIKVVGRVG